MRYERRMPAPEPNSEDMKLSMEVECVLEKEIGRSEILAGADALLEEGYKVSSPLEVVDLMKPFVHEECEIDDLFFPPKIQRFSRD